MRSLLGHHLTTLSNEKQQDCGFVCPRQDDPAGGSASCNSLSHTSTQTLWPLVAETENDQYEACLIDAGIADHVHPQPRRHCSGPALEEVQRLILDGVHSHYRRGSLATVTAACFGFSLASFSNADPHTRIAVARAGEEQTTSNLLRMPFVLRDVSIAFLELRIQACIDKSAYSSFGVASPTSLLNGQDHRTIKAGLSCGA